MKVGKRGLKMSSGEVRKFKSEGARDRLAGKAQKEKRDEQL